MLRKLKEFKLPEVEEKVLKFWKENQIFEKSLKQREGAKPYNFFEGPPTANGKPHIGHVEGRSFKDVMPRYKTMRGFYVARKAGWDTHGLPVEIEIEKELGFKGKQDIEKFGVAEFNEKCKASVWKYKDEWEKLTDRVGFWLDMKDPYVTYHNTYIESLWWVLKKISDRKLLTKSFKIVPWCPRCQTPLSSHEMGQPGVYRKVKDPSVFIKFKLKGRKNEFLLVWTTTPWTLPSNVAIAVNPTLTYTKYKVGKEFFWAYNPPPEKEGVEIEAVEKISGFKLVGLKYEPLYSVAIAKKEKKFFSVKAADFVETTEGTGLVHIAPTFGADDFNLIKKEVKDLAKKAPMTIDERGIMAKGFPGAGKFVKQADKDIMLDLEKRNILYSYGTIEHEYPHCWRCSNPLLYFAKFSWFIEMSKLREKLVENNEQVNWVPDHVKEGRFGEWIRNAEDWALSRDRYWGTPLPIWQCEKCDHVEVVGGLEDFNKLRFSENNFWILRHGEADHVLAGTIASGVEGKNNTSHLTKKGKEEVAKSVAKLAKQLGKKKIDIIISSPYARAKETAKIAAKKFGAKVVVDKRLGELQVGIYNGRLVSDFHKFFQNEMERFTKAPAGGETLTDVRKRVMDFMIEINAKYSGKNILISGHGDPLWILEAANKSLSDQKTLELSYIQIAEIREVKFNNYPYNTITKEVDLHKPYVDKVYLKCKKCGGRMSRVKEVADVWFDSGSMPFAQFHYPFDSGLKRSEELDLKKIQEKIIFPADYISEGMDQTRGWFYTLLSVSTALGIGPAYKNVIAQGLVLDKNGLKMSKSKGNAVNPWDLINKYGSDIVRWYFYTINSPGEYKKFDELDLGKAYRRFIAIIFNSFVFLETYGIFGGKLSDKLSDFNLIDRWILARSNKMIADVTSSLEKYDINAACKGIESFVDDLSRWYIRRSRRRFQKSESKEDLEAASAVLYYCLLELSKLIAPFAPFFADALYRSLDEKNLKLSVHLEDWPTIKEEFANNEIIEKMEELRRLSSLALALRAEKKIKVRQPLSKLEINTKKLTIKDVEFLELIKDEVNVKDVSINLQLKGEIELDTVITPELRNEGLMRDLARMVQDLRQAGGCVPKDKVYLMIETDKELEYVIEPNRDALKKDVGASEVELKRSDKFDAEITSEMDGKKIWIGIRKI
ncbi:MAG: class I tRNA ligase family protein [Patescibacteria group bacterium]|nr:class I tRNA ligase family protein [Patescibacteria group bacterium]